MDAIRRNCTVEAAEVGEKIVNAAPSLHNFNEIATSGIWMHRNLNNRGAFSNARACLMNRTSDPFVMNADNDGEKRPVFADLAYTSYSFSKF